MINHFDMRIKIYCEDGALTKEIKELRTTENIELFVFPFENKNRKVSRSNKPSMLTWDNKFITWDDTSIKFNDTDKSELFEGIAEIVGENHLNDIRHIDTAYKETCIIFISPDKDDIVSKAKALEKLTGIKFFYSQDIQGIRAAIHDLKKG